MDLRLNIAVACSLLVSLVIAQDDRNFDPFEQTQQEAPQGPIAEVRFDAMVHDFGTIYQGSENPHVFKFKNTGTVPLIITGATGSCGCTVPYYAREPILPGEESEIHIEYKPGKQKGHQTKSVTITANTDPSPIILRITADVIEVDSVTAPSIFAREKEFEEQRSLIGTVNPGCFVLFPNPAADVLRLDLKEHIGRTANVRILDQTGREMLQTRIARISSEASAMDVAAFPSGIYIATIQVEDLPPMSQCFVVSR